ncbi:MAG TPA: hypothetical protein VGF79_11265 [Bacteroidia bacterium]
MNLHIISVLPKHHHIYVPILSLWLNRLVLLGPIRFIFQTYFKVYALILKKVFQLKENLLYNLKSNKIKKVVFTKKFEWDEILIKHLKASGIQVQFEDIENIDYNEQLVVPLTINDLKIYSRNKDKFKRNMVPVPSDSAFEICHNKGLFNEFMVNNGFGNLVPSHKLPDLGKFPYVLKKKMDEGGVETYMVSNQNDLNLLGSKIFDPSYQVEEFLPGRREYATHVLFKDGKIVSAVNICYLFETGSYVKGKDKYICKYITTNPHLKQFSEVLNTMGYEGICCFNYKEIKGVPKIFEINPRFGGSLTEYFIRFLRDIH